MKASPRRKLNSEQTQNTNSPQRIGSIRNLLATGIAFGHSLLSHLDSKTRLGLSMIDNFAVGIAYGIKKIKIGTSTNLFIAFVSAIGTYLALAVGKDINHYLSVNAANVLGSGVLIAVGVWSIWETLKQKRSKAKRRARMREEARYMLASSDQLVAPIIADAEYNDSCQEFLEEYSYEKFLEHPEKADADHSGYIDVRESIALAFGLTLNNLGSGIGGGISNLNVLITSLLVFALSVFGVAMGYILGKRFTTRISGYWAGILSGAIVITIGIYEYFIYP
jgi:putative Mn2+ efflux pump MntP